MAEVIFLVLFFGIGWALLSPTEKKKVFEEEKEEVLREGYFLK